VDQLGARDDPLIKPALFEQQNLLIRDPSITRNGSSISDHLCPGGSARFSSKEPDSPGGIPGSGGGGAVSALLKDWRLMSRPRPLEEAIITALADFSGESTGNAGS
jgi:hypothetical protein